MSLLTAGSPIIRENAGSLTYIQIPLTTLTNSDTFSIGVGAPVVNVDVQGDSISAGGSNSGDATFSSTTGLVTIVSPTQGAITLILLMRT